MHTVHMLNPLLKIGIINVLNLCDILLKIPIICVSLSLCVNMCYVWQLSLSVCVMHVIFLSCNTHILLIFEPKIDMMKFSCPVLRTPFHVVQHMT